jgi:dolichol-phosphate mannosyltransferase
VEQLNITETGWGMPLQLWVQAARLGLRIREVAVPRLYLDPNRAFGGVLNDAEERLAYYQRVIASAEAEIPVTRQHEASKLSPCSWTALMPKGSCR